MIYWMMCKRCSRFLDAEVNIISVETMGIYDRTESSDAKNKIFIKSNFETLPNNLHWIFSMSDIGNSEKIKTTSRDINYLGKDFNSFKKNLVRYAKSYFPKTYKDFSENSTGMMFIELAILCGRCVIILY